MSRKFYAVENSMASQSSLGFANSWRVLVFDSRALRDDYVDQDRKLGTKAIKRAEIGKWADKPKSFSLMKRIVIYEDDESGVGTVIVGHPENGYPL